MVRVDRDLKRCYFYRIKVEGDVRKIVSPEPPPPPSPIKAKADIIPYNPHFRRETSTRQTVRPNSRRISWSRDADRVREISPRSSPPPVPVVLPAPQPKRSFSADWTNEEKYPMLPATKTKKKKKKPKPAVLEQKIVPRQYNNEPARKSAVIPQNTKRNPSNNINYQREKRYQSQRREQKKRTASTTNLRKVKSESNLRNLSEPLMQRTSKTDTKKKHKKTPPPWLPVGDRTRHKKTDKHSRSYISDYHF